MTINLSFWPTTAFAVALAVPASSQDKQTLVEHYRRVAAELRADTPSGLSPQLVERRRNVLRELDRYRAAAAFGVSPVANGDRVPMFIDPQGRRCAVAWLLDRTGESALTQSVAKTNNGVWVAELEGHPAFERWLDDHGLTIGEAARIQMPTEPPPSTRRPPRWEQADGSTNEMTSRLSDDDRLSHRRSAAARTATSGSLGVPVDAYLVDESWLTWWDWNAPALLGAAERRVASLAPVTPSGRSRAERGIHLDDVRQQLVEALDSTNATTRAAACLALGRLGDPRDVKLLEEHLKDASRGVRNDAILALGAHASGRAVHSLSKLVGDGRLRSDEAVLTPEAASLATLALAVAARRAGRPGSAQLVHAIANQTDGKHGESARIATLLHDRIIRGRSADSFSRQLATDGGTAIAVRSLATEQLEFADPDNRGDLMRALSSRHLSLRRSAALALGRTDDHLALPGLLSAFEMEREQFTRALILLAIGEHDEPRARDFLLRELREGRKPLRSWAAIALGVWSRDRQDPEAEAAIRDGFEAEANRDHRPAFLLAMGLARDPLAKALLKDVLYRGGQSIERSVAAQALVLGDGGALDDLRHQLKHDSCSYARSIAAETLGLIGEPEDAARLAAALPTLQTPEERQRLAQALGRLGGLRAVRTIRDALAAASESERAALIQALGLALDQHPEPLLAPIARVSNFTVLPSWLRAAIASGL